MTARLAVARADGRARANALRGVILCADDYGLSPAVSAGIREAMAAERISAVSAMAAGPAWQKEGLALAAFAGSVSLGLHLTLTDLAPLGPMPRLAPDGRLPSPADLARRAFSGSLPLEEIALEVHRQWDRFTKVLGREPDHVDGHHHVHHLPGIRDILVARILRQPAAQRPWVRLCRPPLASLAQGRGAMKALAVLIAGRGMATLLERHGIGHSGALGGLYDFADRRAVAELWPRLLRGLPDGAVVLCHPGRVDDALRDQDSLTDRRAEELDFLLSDAFPDLLGRLGLRLVTQPG